MQSIIINAHAKINLTLYVGNVLENGYHNIDTVMHTVELHDIITLSKASRLSLAVTEGTAPSGEDFICQRGSNRTEISFRVKEKNSITSRTRGRFFGCSCCIKRFKSNV